MTRGIVAARWPLVIVYLAVCGGVIWTIGGRLGTEIFPQTDNGQFAVRLRAPSGTQVALTEAMSGQVLRLIEGLEDLEDVQRVYSNADFSDEAIESYPG